MQRKGPRRQRERWGALWSKGGVGWVREWGAMCTSGGSVPPSSPIRFHGVNEAESGSIQEMIEILRAELVSDEPLFDTVAVTVLGQSPIGRSQSDGA